jgi:hypothetical protein
MGIDLETIKKLRKSSRASAQVGHLPQEVAAYIGSRLGIVYLSSASVEHILFGHADLEEIDLVCLTDAMLRSNWFKDRSREAVFIYEHPDTQLSYKGAIKCVADGYEVYIKTFHRIGPRNKRRIVRKHEQI